VLFRSVKSLSSTTREKVSEGRSKAFFYYSADQKYVVKTTSYDELVNLLKILPEYVNHIKMNQESLLTRFVGAHCITMYGIDFYFVVMKNLCPRVHEKFDLKGSWIGRRTLKGPFQRRDRGEKGGDPSSRHTPVYKDIDLQDRIHLPKKQARLLGEIIRMDVDFIKGFGYMDFSLLVGVKRNVSEKSEKELADGYYSSSEERSEIYYFGIIDFLQEWNWNKKFERLAKSFWYWNNISGISSVDPETYAERFMNRAVYDVIAFSNKDETDERKLRDVLGPRHTQSPVGGMFNTVQHAFYKTSPPSNLSQPNEHV